MERYYRMREDGSMEFAGNSIITGDRLVINPTREQLMEAGWQVYEHEETLEEAKAAYDVTQQHIAAISAMTEIEEVKGYDFTAGYPDRLVFSLAADNNDNNSGQGDENL